MRVLIILMIILQTFGSDIDNYIPKNAYKYKDIVYKVAMNELNDSCLPYYMDALIEQESCVVLRGNSYYARRCWSPISELKTKREQGVGFFQITRVFKKDGSVRWDMLATMKRRYKKQLRDVDWDNIKSKPDKQILMGILLWKDNYRRFNKNIDDFNRMLFADSVYNGGFKYLNRERKYCKLKKDCDPNIWFDNVEKVKSKRARRKLYGNRTAWDINRDHVRKVVRRISKYVKAK